MSSIPTTRSQLTDALAGKLKRTDIQHKQAVLDPRTGEKPRPPRSAEAVRLGPKY